MTDYIGTTKSDTITISSTTSADAIIGLEGSDKLTSLFGDASLYGDVEEDVVLNFSSLSQVSATVYPMKNTYDGLFGHIPKFGNDTLTALNGSNTMYGDAVHFIIDVHGSDNLAAGVSAPVIITNLNINFGNDTLYSSGGNNIMYGDLEVFSVSLVAGSDGAKGSDATVRIGVLGGTVGSSTPGLQVAFGNDSITTGSGNDHIYGDTQNYLVSLLSGSNSVGATARARLDDGKTTFGNDKVFSGDGNDVVYGDVQNFTMTLTSGDNGSNNRAQDVTNYSFGNDMIQAGNGNDKIYGDAQNVNWTFTVGSGLDGTYDALGPNYDILAVGEARWVATLTYGNDTILAGNGANRIYGDVQNWLVTSTVGQGMNGDGAIAVAGIGDVGTTPTTAASIHFGNDQISVGSGNNFIYGDADLVQFIGQVPNNLLSTAMIDAVGPTAGNLTFGNDQISAGNGVNTVYGDVASINELYSCGNFSGIGAVSFAERSEFDFTFGADKITVGSGGNTVYGDAGAYLMQFHAGDHASGGVANGYNSYDPAVGDITGVEDNDVFNAKTIFGADFIASGSGSDILVGDVGTFTMSFKAGLHVDGSTGPEAVSSGIGMYNAIEGYPYGADNSPVTFGNDEIHGGGGADTIYGEGIQLSISAVAGSIDAPFLGESPNYDPNTGLFTNPNTGHTLLPTVAVLDVRSGIGDTSPVAAGNDKLYGDAGNDVIYGDWKALNITLHDGQGTGLSIIPELTDASIGTIKLGDDVLIGGSSNDVLYGDVAAVNFQHLDAMGNLITNDILGPNSNVHHFIAGNNILFGGAGDDVITGGTTGLTGSYGKNQFVYDGGLNNGHDQILDFHVGMDTLVGQNGAKFSDGGLVNNNLVINVHDAAGDSSTITLMNVHTDIFGSIVQAHTTVV
jgi:Ca2+-binding RTX toxin-like protein